MNRIKKAEKIVRYHFVWILEFAKQKQKIGLA